MLERLKQIRKKVKLNQSAFGKRIQMSQSGYAQIENGSRSLNDRLIRLICLEFNVNENWFRNGTGGSETMFIQSDDSLLSELANEYNLDNMDKLIIESFIKLPTEHRKILKSYIYNLVESVISQKESSATKEDTFDIDQEVESYRKELEDEKKGGIQ